VEDLTRSPLGKSGASFAFGTSTSNKQENMPLFSFTLSRTPGTVFHDAGIRSDGKISYTNLNLSIAPCVEKCKPAQ